MVTIPPTSRGKRRSSSVSLTLPEEWIPQLQSMAEAGAQPLADFVRQQLARAFNLPVSALRHRGRPRGIDGCESASSSRSDRTPPASMDG